MSDSNEPHKTPNWLKAVVDGDIIVDPLTYQSCYGIASRAVIGPISTDIDIYLENFDLIKQNKILKEKLSRGIKVAVFGFKCDIELLQFIYQYLFKKDLINCSFSRFSRIFIESDQEIIPITCT